MNIHELSINPSIVRSDLYFLRSPSDNGGPHQTISEVRHTGLQLYSAFSVHQDNLQRNSSNFTVDTSVSSTYTPTYSRLNDAVVQPLHSRSGESMNSAERSHNSKVSTKIAPRSSRSQLDLLTDHSSRRSDHQDRNRCTDSEIPSSSVNDEFVKITNASACEFACTTKTTPPRIVDCPPTFKTLAAAAEAVRLLAKQTESLRFCHKLVNRGIQTTPVLILPLSPDHKMVEINKKKSVVTSGNSRTSTLLDPYGSRTTDMSVSIRQKESKGTDAPCFRARTSQAHQRTSSDFTAYSKDKETSFINLAPESRKTTTNSEMEENHTNDVVWGDVYNDYKAITLDLRNSQQHLQNKATGGDSTKTCTTETAFRKMSTLGTVSSSTPRSVLGGITMRPRSRISHHENQLTLVDLQQRYFELPPFDEIVKSYLTYSDRRVRAVCSRMICHIRLFGPSTRVTSEPRSHPQLCGRDKTVYTLLVASDSKDRLEKAIKCVQETFPKACLSEKFFSNQTLGQIGDEIPL